MSDQVVDNDHNKDLIKKILFKKNNDTITCYSAEWCGACRRIKPDFLKYISENNFIEESNDYILKSDYKNLNTEYKFIPAFIVNDKYIQTSSIDTLKEFISKNTLTVLDDF